MNVRRKQHLLLAMGYFPGAVDGDEGPKTKAAAAKCESEHPGALGYLIDYIDGLEEPASDQEPVHDDNNVNALDSGYPYFSLAEFRCQCNDNNCVGKSLRPSDALLNKLVDIRTRFGAPVTITSGIRCPEHNYDVGGVSNSYHLSGRAADINVKGYSAAQVLAYCSGLQLHYCYAIDSAHVHIDI